MARATEPRHRAPSVSDRSFPVATACSWAEVRRLSAVTSGRSAVIGTTIGALPGVGSTLAATLGYAVGKARHDATQCGGVGERNLETGAMPEGVAATEAANSAGVGRKSDPGSVPWHPRQCGSGFPDPRHGVSIGGFNPGPAVFQSVSRQHGCNTELVIAFGHVHRRWRFANLLNWIDRGADYAARWAIMSAHPEPDPAAVSSAGHADGHLCVQETRLDAHSGWPSGSACWAI